MRSLHCDHIARGSRPDSTMGNSPLLAALKDPRAAALAEEMTAFDNLRVREVEAHWRAFYDYAASFALTRNQFRSICCSAARALHAQAATSRAAADADRVFGLFAGRSASSQGYGRTAGDAGDAVVDALEFYSSMAFVAAMPLDDKVDLLFDSWDMSDDGQLDLDEFTISLKSTLSGLAKILRLRAPPGQPDAFVRLTGALDEAELAVLAEATFRDIRSASVAASVTPQNGQESVTCEQFRQFCTTNQRAKALFALFDLISAQPANDESSQAASGKADAVDTGEWGRVRQPKDDQLQAPSAVESSVTDISSVSDAGDEFLAVKPWKGAIVPPTKVPALSSAAPAISLRLDWIHGYSAQENSRNNLRYVTTAKSCASGRPDEIIYPAAAVCVVLNTRTMVQRHLLAHTDDILSLCVHSTLPVAASGEIGKQPKIVVWDLESAEATCVLKGFHQRGVLLLAFASVDTLVSVGGDEDHSIAIYESKDSWRSAALKITSKGNKAVPFSLATPSTVASTAVKQFVVCGQKFVEFWAIEGNALTSKKGLLGQKGTQQPFVAVECITKASNGPASAVVGTTDGKLYVFSGRELSAAVSAHKGAVTALFYLGGVLLSGGKDGQILLWDDNLKQVGGPIAISDVVASTTGARHYSSIRSCCLSPDKRTLLVGTEASEIYELDAKTGESCRSESPLVKAHFSGELWGLAVHPTKPQFCTVGDDQTLRIWDLVSRRELRSTNLESSARACAYSPDGKMIAVGFGGVEARQATSSQAKSAGSRGGGGRGRTGSTRGASPQGGFVVYGEADLTKVKEACFDPKKWVSDVKFSPDGRYLALASHDCKVYVYDVLNGFARRHVFKKHSSYISHIDFSSDGNYLQSTCGAYELLFSEVQSGRQVTSAATFRDERWHTMTSTLGWSVQGIWEPESDGTDVNAVDRSKNGKVLATGDDFGKVKLFQYPCALEKAASVELRGHSSHVTNVRWSVDDAFVVSVGGNDRCVFVWKHDKQQISTIGNSIEISDENDGVKAGHSRRRKSSVALVELQPTPSEEATESEGDDFYDNRSDKPAASMLEEGPEGDEFMAVKPWLGAIVPPTNAKVLQKTGSSAPDVQLALEYIHGYQSQNASNNARYDAVGRVVYHAAAVGIVADKQQQQQHAPRQRFFQGHDDDVIALCAHPNGSTFATAQMGKHPKIFVWSSEDCSASAPCIEGFHQRFVSAICFSSDGSKLGSVGGDDDHSVAIYSWEKNLLVASAKGERHAVKSICYHSSSQEWITCGERHVRFWKEQGKNLTSKRAIFGKAAEQKLASVFECVISFGSAAVAGGSDGNLYVFQGSNELSRTVNAHGSTAVFALAASPDSGAANELVSGGKDGKIAIWSTQFAKVAIIDLSEVAATTSSSTGLLNAAVRSIHISKRSSRSFLIGTMGSDLVEVDASCNSKPTMRFVTRGHYHMELWGLTCHPKKPEYCTAGDDQTIRIWCAEKRIQLRIARLRAAARACAISPSGELVALGYGGRAQHQAKKSTTKKSEGGRSIDCTGVMEILDYNDLTKSVIHDKPSKQAISEVKFSPTGETLAVGSHDHCIYIYRLERKANAWSVRKTGVFNKHQSYITHLDFSADGEFLQSNCGAYELLFSRADSGKHITSASSVKDVNWATWTCVLGWPVQGIWPPCSDGTDVNAVARCSKGEFLAAADDFGCVKLFRYPCVVKNAASNEYRSHSSHVTNVRWCANDTKLVSVGGLDRCVMQWSVVQSDHGVSAAKFGQATTSDLEIIDLDSPVSGGGALSYGKEVDGNSTEDPYGDPGQGDEFMAVKPWVGAIVAPSNAPVPNAREPDIRVDLEWVYGYQSALARQNVSYNQHNEVVYHTAAVGIIYDASSHFQKHHIGHNDDITSFAIGGPQRSLIATGERGKAPVIRIWDSHTGELRSELRAGALASQSRAILSLAFSSDSTRLVSVGADDNHTIALWEDASHGGTWASPRLVASVKGDRGLNMFAAFGSTRDMVVTGGVKHVLFWAIQGKNSMTAKKGQVGKAGTLQQFPTGCAFAASAGGNDDTFVTGTATGELYVWKGSQLSKAVKAHEGEVRVVVSTDCFVDSRGQRTPVLLSGGKDGRIVVWTSGFQSIRSFSVGDTGGMNGGSSIPCLNPAINSICLRDDGSMLLVGTCSSDIFELSITATSSGGFDSSPHSLLVSGHFSMELWGLAVHPSRRQFVTTGDDATMRLWDMDARRIVSLARLPNKARAVAFSGDGELLAVGFGGDNGGVGRRRPAAAKSSKAQPVKQSSEGAFKLFATREVSAGRATPLFEDKPAKEWISDVKFSPDDALVALGSHDNAIYLYSLDKQLDRIDSQSVPRVSVTKRKPFAKHNSYVTHLDFSADGGHVQSNCGAYEYLFCDTSTSEQVRSASALKNTQWATWTCVLGWPVQGIWPACADGTDVNAVCASQSRTLLASGDDSGLLKLFRFPCVLKGVRELAGCVRSAVSSVWGILTRCCCCSVTQSQFVACRGHSSHVTSVRFSHDDKYVISVGGNDRSIFQWKLS